MRTKGAKGRTVKQRLMSFVEKTHDGCWNWQGAKDKDGYGFIRISGKNMKAHRTAFEIFNEIAIGRANMVCHSCDNPSCINPEHLWIGDNKTNQIDAVKKKRNGSQKLTESQVKAARRSYYAREKTQAQLCKELGISTGCMSSIITGRKWAHVN